MRGNSMICELCGAEVKPEHGSHCNCCGFSFVEIEQMDKKILEKFKEEY